MGSDPDDLALLVAAAQSAGQVAMRHFKMPMAVTEKPDGQGPVSAGDLAVNAHLVAILRAARPDYGWLSEEGPAEPPRPGPCFIVDPIDGTRSYIAGQPGFAVALAVVAEGRVQAAAVHLPARGETYAAAAGGGATRDGLRIGVSARAVVSGARALIAKSALEPPHWPGGVPEVDRQFRPSLAWRLCLVAAGEMDLMVTFGDTWVWDVAAGALIAAEAGAAVSDRNGAEPVFGAGAPQVPGLIVAPPGLHADLLRRRHG